ncbi:MAG: type II toxin-antitoxin system HicB family antitoxin [Gallionella sp.]
MKNNLLEYRSYQGSVEFSSEDKILYGKFLFIDSLIMYHGESVCELESAFHIAVDEYLEHCLKNGKEPNKPYSGGFNIRIGSELHRAAAQYAYREDKSLNEFVKQAIEKAIFKQPVKTHELTINHIVTHQHKVETAYALEEQSWQSVTQKIPKLRVIQ